MSSGTSRTSYHYSKLHYFSKYRYLRTFLLKTINWLSCLFISFSLSFSIPVHAEDRALIVGINEYQYVTPLKGSITDARRVLQLLQKLDMYRANQIRLLSDSQATRQGILDGLDWLVSGSQAGDKVLFYFSGHGAQVSDASRDESDGLDETLCPVETTLTRQGMITDDEVNERLKRLNGRQVLVVIDSCHSGTITKGNIPKGVQLKTPLFTKPLPETKAITNESLVNSSTQGEMIVYSAVASNQVAIDTTDGGIFTSAFLKVIEEKKGKISHKEILDVVKQASTEACQQYQSVCRLGLTPQLEVSADSLENKAIFSVSKPASPEIPLRDVLSLKILPSETLRIGDKMSFNVTNTSQQAGYVVIWDVDGNGKVTCIFPDSNSGKNKGYLQAGQTLTIPNADDEFEFNMGEPTGKGMTVVVLAHSESVAKQLGALSTDSFTKGIRGHAMESPDFKGIERVSKSKATEVAVQVKRKLVEILKQENVILLKDYEIIR